MWVCVSRVIELNHGSRESEVLKGDINLDRQRVHVKAPDRGGKKKKREQSTRSRIKGRKTGEALLPQHLAGKNWPARLPEPQGPPGRRKTKKSPRPKEEIRSKKRAEGGNEGKAKDYKRPSEITIYHRPNGIFGLGFGCPTTTSKGKDREGLTGAGQRQGRGKTIEGKGDQQIQQKTRLRGKKVTITGTRSRTCTSCSRTVFSHRDSSGHRAGKAEEGKEKRRWKEKLRHCLKKAVRKGGNFLPGSSLANHFSPVEDPTRTNVRRRDSLPGRQCPRAAKKRQ